MSFNNTGAVLEGFRIASGNNPFTFPPRDYIQPENYNLFNSTKSRAEYNILASSINPSKQSLEIADAELVFIWTKNESTVIRFDYDGYSRRWLPSPGGPPDNLGIISNTQRLVYQVPDITLGDSPFSIYVGFPTRIINFKISLVSDTTEFTNPPPGTVQISEADGKLNFNSDDVNLYKNQTVYSTRQSFFDRTKTKGIIGQLPISADIPYFLFLNPLPGSGQSPRIRIDYQFYLTPIQVPNEALLGNPSPGTFTWSLDTGRIQFSKSDAASNLGKNIYYDGVTLGNFNLTKIPAVVSGSFPSAAFNIPGFVGQTDPTLFLVYVEIQGKPRQYFSSTVIDTSQKSPGQAPTPGSVFIDTASGNVYISNSDLNKFNGNYYYIQTFALLEDGVTVQFFRSGVNGAGEEVEPDFTIEYNVQNQTIIDGIIQTPFVMLPTTPIINADLKFTIAQGQGSSGTFTGDLVDGTDKTKLGIGYLLDLDNHQLKFSNRKIVPFTLPKTVPSIKLADAAVSQFGFEVVQNSVLLEPGTDFEFDATTGLIEFIEPVGEDDPNNIFGISGVVTSLNTIKTLEVAFTGNFVGQNVFISSGPNTGIYNIIQAFNDSVQVVPNFILLGQETFDIRAKDEIIADRFWVNIQPPYKKISVAQASSPQGPYTPLQNSEFSVLPTTGQINLNTPANPGQSFLVNYISLDSPDNGVTVTPTNRTEKAIFKIGQETCTTSSGSNIVHFNSSGHTVSLEQPITLFIDGVTQDPSAFQFTPPGTLELATQITTETVIANYFVEDAPGGNTNFNLSFIPIDLDPPQIISGNNRATFNGNQTGAISPGSALLIGGNETVLVGTVTYDAANDVTDIVFSQVPQISSNGAVIQTTGKINGSYEIKETASVDIFPNQTNILSITGKLPYIQNMVVTVDGDAYLVSSVKYDAVRNKTLLTTAGPAKRNYIIPKVTRTIRPIYFPNSNFNTSLPANLAFPFTLILMGTSGKILQNNIDYTVSDGGAIQLSTTIGFQDSLIALYVARKNIEAGTEFQFNYAYNIAPGSFGLVGQQLIANYDLYAPDSFFYRIETIETFVPEVVQLIQQSAKSTGVSGPNTSSQKTLQTKDFGSPSLYFDEQHLGNIDIVLQRLLKFYNDFINQYEDLLANFDGRVVGGTSGRFRYDGLLNNPPRNSYSGITNDIDDRVLLYNVVTLTGFFSFGSSPVYAQMSEPNALSRIFSTKKLATAAINGNVSAADFGQVIGSLSTNNITSVGQFTSTPANSFWTSTSGNIFLIPKNGDPTNLVPPFSPGQKIQIYNLDGTEDAVVNIISISGQGPFIVTVDNPSTIQNGSLLQITSDSTVTVNHFYTPGRDLSVINDNGQILNQTFSGPLASIQNPVIGNELIDTNLTFTNTNTIPTRIPALDGSLLTDDGHISAPQMKYVNENDLLVQESQALRFSFGHGALTNTRDSVINSTIQVKNGNNIEFINGPNAGLVRTATAVLSSNSFRVDLPFTFADSTGSDFVILGANDLKSVLNLEVQVLDLYAETAPVGNAIIGKKNSEITTCYNLILGLCPVITSGTGTTTNLTITDDNNDFLQAGVTINSLLFIQNGPDRGVYKLASVQQNQLFINPAPPFGIIPGSFIPAPYTILNPLASGAGITTPTTLSDPLANFVNDKVLPGSLLFIPGGPGLGIYKVLNVIANQITIDGTAPFSNIPFSGSVPYIVFNSWSFVNEKEVEFLAPFFQDEIEFVTNTRNWTGNPTTSRTAQRLLDINARLSKIPGYINAITDLLTSGDKLYDIRYSWIQERTDRKAGILVQEMQAAKTRQDNLQKLLADQQRLIIAQSLE